MGRNYALVISVGNSHSLTVHQEPPLGLLHARWGGLLPPPMRNCGRYLVPVERKAFIHGYIAAQLHLSQMGNPSGVTCTAAS